MTSYIDKADQTSEYSLKQLKGDRIIYLMSQLEHRFPSQCNSYWIDSDCVLDSRFQTIIHPLGGLLYVEYRKTSFTKGNHLAIESLGNENSLSEYPFWFNYICYGNSTLSSTIFSITKAFTACSMRKLNIT